MDASLLLLGWYGFVEPRDPSHARDVRADRASGSRRATGLLYRYEESRAAGEGAFGICGFWAAEHLARGGGTLAEAEARFERLLAYANDVGLLRRGGRPRARGEPLGNFPQAFTHVGLVSAALALEERGARRSASARGRRPPIAGRR